MSVITGDPTNFPGSLTIPDDGQNVKAANINPAEQAHANRTARLARLLLPSGATSFFTGVATPSDLTAITGMVNLETRFVDGYGLYVYRSADTSLVSSPWIVAGNGGVGRWLHAERAQAYPRLIAREEIVYEGARIDVIAAAKTVTDPGNRSHVIDGVAILTSANTYNIEPGDLLEIGYTVPYLSGGAVGADPVVGVGFSITGAGVLTYPDVLLDNSCQTTADVDRGGRDQGFNFPSGSVVSKYNFARSHCTVQEVIGNQKVCLAIAQTAGAAGAYYVTQGASLSINHWRVSFS